jgi:hypothetical protein
MPGPVSDSRDPEFGTGENADLVRFGITELRDKITKLIGSDKLLNIVDLCDGVLSKKLRSNKTWILTERELRILRFALDRALESI